jgi:hypothetical protein
MTNLPYYNPNCCAKCGTRTDTETKIKNRRRINTEWLKKYFKTINIDIDHYKYVCYQCYKSKLIKLKSELINEIYSDQQKIKNLTSKSSNKKNIVKLNLKKDDVSDIPSDQMYDLTGLTRINFIDLYDKLKGKWKHEFCLKNILFFYLMRLRLGLTSKKITSIFPIASQTTMYRHIKKLKEFLMKNFVEQNLGIDHITRRMIQLRHTTQISKTIFESDEDSIITVWDGTYVYIQKSSNYSFQRQTYSMHKNRPLVKMMMIVTTTGILFSIFILFLIDLILYKTIF